MRTEDKGKMSTLPFDYESDSFGMMNKKKRAHQNGCVLFGYRRSLKSTGVPQPIMVAYHLRKAVPSAASGSSR